MSGEIMHVRPVSERGTGNSLSIYGEEDLSIPDISHEGCCGAIHTSEHIIRIQLLPVAGVVFHGQACLLDIVDEVFVESHGSIIEAIMMSDYPAQAFRFR